MTDLQLLTGATGSLGAHILHILQKSPKVSKIVCLVRASSHQEAHYRVSRSLIARKKPSLAPDDDKVLCVSARYEKPEMWNSTDLTKLIKETCGMVIHVSLIINLHRTLLLIEYRLHGLSTSPYHSSPSKINYKVSTISLSLFFPADNHRSSCSVLVLPVC